MAQEKKRLLEEKGREKQAKSIRNRDSQGRAQPVLSTIDKSGNPAKKQEPKHDTRKELAKELNWSTGKVAMARRSAVLG